MANERLENYKNFAELVQSYATVIALIIGGAWTYSLFIKQRTGEPKLEVSTSVSVVTSIPSKRIVVVDEKLKNSGTVPVVLRRGKVVLRQIVPPPPEALALLSDPAATVIKPDRDAAVWNAQVEDRSSWNAGEFQIEPAESDQIHTEFVIPCSIEVVAVIAFVSDQESGGVGWNTTSLVDLKKERTTSCAK
jgi:hypothetical protein